MPGGPTGGLLRPAVGVGGIVTATGPLPRDFPLDSVQLYSDNGVHLYWKGGAMSGRTRLSGPELELSQVVARLGEGTVRDVAAALPAGRGMERATVQTYLRRLHAKGYLAKRRDGRADVYRPAARRAGGVVRDVVRDLVDRVFAGDALPLVQQLIDDRRLSDAQLDELQATLDALRAGRKGKL